MDLKTLCLQVAKGIADRQIDKFKIGDDSQSAFEDAKSGLWATKKKKRSVNVSNVEDMDDPLKIAYDFHNQREKEKNCFKDKRLAQGDQQLQEMRSIGKAIHFMSMTDSDYWSYFKMYVSMEFGPMELRKTILSKASDHKTDCIELWRVVERKPEKFNDKNKNEAIQSMFEEWIQ